MAITHAELRRAIAEETDPEMKRSLQWLLDRTPEEKLAAGTVSAPMPEVMPDLDGNVERPRGVEGLY